MAYDRANGPQVALETGIGGTDDFPKFYRWRADDAIANIDGVAGYITDAKERGMKVGDYIWVLPQPDDPAFDTTDGPMPLQRMDVRALVYTNEGTPQETYAATLTSGCG